MPSPFYLRAFFSLALIFLLATACQKNDITGMYNFEEEERFVKTGYFPIDLHNFYSFNHDVYFMFQPGGPSSRKEHSEKASLVNFHFYPPTDIKNPIGEITLGNTNKGSLLFEAEHQMTFQNYLDPDYIAFGTSIDLELRLHSNPEYNFILPINIPSEFEITQFSRELNVGDTIKWVGDCKYSENGIWVELEIRADNLLFTKTSWLPSDIGYFVISKSFIQDVPKNAELTLKMSRINYYHRQLLGGRKSVGIRAFTYFYRTVHIPE